MTLLGKIFNAIHDDESAEISSIDEKLSPSINDLLLIEDSEDGNNKKSVLIGNLPTGGGDYSGFGEVFVNLFSGSETTDENNWKSLGASEIDTAKFGFDGYFEAVLSSSDDAGAAELRLVNITTNAQIGDILEVNGEVSFVSEQITLTSGVNIYEAQLRSPDGYYAVCKNARVSFYKFILNAPDASEDGYVAIAQSGDLVYIGGETDGYVLTWNAGLNSWEPQTPTINVVGEEQGSVLYFDGSGWVQLPPGQDGYALITHDTGANPTWGEVASSAPITTVFGRIGDIVATIDDYSASQINNDSTVAGEQVSNALEYLDGYIGDIYTLTVGGDLSGSLPNPEVTDLSIASEEQGSVLYYNGSNWVQLPPGDDGYALTTHGTGADPTWAIAGNDIYAIHDNIPGEISTIAEKATPAATDLLIIEDSADLNNKKRIQISSIFSIPGLSGMMNDAFVATENQTDFTLSQSPSNDVAIMVVDGITQSSLDYTVSGTSITYSGLVLSAGQAVDFWYSLGTGSGSGGSGVQFISILSGIETHDLDGWKTVGIVEITSTEFTGTASIEAVLYTSDGYADGYARLYNSTTMTQIGSDLTTTNNLPTLLSSAITLTAGSNLYELQIRVEQDGTDEFVSCGMGRVKITGSSGGGGTIGETWISPDPLGSDVNDWNPTGFSTATIVRVDTVDDGYSITGFDASATVVKKEIINVSAYDIIIAHQNTGSVEANRTISQTGGLILAADDSMTIIYDPVTERWRVI